MRCFVTGGSGFIGGHVVRELLAAGHEVVALSRPGSPLGNLAGLDVERVPGDLADEQAVRTGCRGADWVFHVAALYAFWPPDWDLFDRSNVQGTERVIRIAAEAGAKRIVHTSSTAAVGAAPSPDRPVDETHVWDLAETGDRYVISKKHAEDAALALAAKGAPVVVVNPCGPFGPLDPKPTPTGDLLRQYVAGLMAMYPPGGNAWADVRDVARGHLLAAERGQLGRRYILAAENLSYKDTLELFSRVTGLPAGRGPAPFPVVATLSALLELAAHVTRKTPLLTRPQARMSRRWMFYDARRSREELGLTYGPVEVAVRDAVLDMVARGALPPRSRRRLERAHRLALPGS